MKESQAQPKVLIDAMDEIMQQNAQFNNQQRVKLTLQVWQLKAENEGLKKRIAELEIQEVKRPSDD